MGKRLDYVDFIRGVAMLSIILVHSNVVLFFDGITQYLYSWQIWIFFFISGYLSKKIEKNDLPRYYLKQIKRLVIPYFFLVVVADVANVVLFGESSKIALINNLLYSHLHFGTMWFLPALFICAVIMTTAISFSNRGILPIVVCILFYSFMIINMKSGFVPNWFRFMQAISGMPFFLVGYYCRGNKKAFKGKLNILLAIVLIGFGIVLCFFNDKVHVSQMELGNICLSFVSALFTIIGFFEAVTGVSSFNFLISKALLYIGRNSFKFLWVHIYCSYFVFDYLLSKYIHLNSINLGMYWNLLIGMILEILLSFVIVHIINLLMRQIKNGGKKNVNI